MMKTQIHLLVNSTRKFCENFDLNLAHSQFCLLHEEKQKTMGDVCQFRGLLKGHGGWVTSLAVPQDEDSNHIVSGVARQVGNHVEAVV
jgi:hypothetical protein